MAACAALHSQITVTDLTSLPFSPSILSGDGTTVAGGVWYVSSTDLHTWSEDAGLRSTTINNSRFHFVRAINYDGSKVGAATWVSSREGEPGDRRHDGTFLWEPGSVPFEAIGALGYSSTRLIGFDRTGSTIVVDFHDAEYTGGESGQVIWPGAYQTGYFDPGSGFSLMPGADAYDTITTEDISDNGRFLMGYLDVEPGDSFTVRRQPWILDRTTHDLSVLPAPVIEGESAFFANGQRISDDGSTALVRAGRENDDIFQQFIYSEGEYEELAAPGLSDLYVDRLTADGLIAGGYGYDEVTDQRIAVLWLYGIGLITLEEFLVLAEFDFSSYSLDFENDYWILDMSVDGSTILVSFGGDHYLLSGLDYFRVIPEPSILSMLVPGLVAIVWLRRR